MCVSRVVGLGLHYRFFANFFLISHRKQNSDYIDYLMKALYFECRKSEDWESKTDSDLDQFSWETSRIKAKEMVR